LLSVNDHILQIATPNSVAQLVRIGVRKDCMGDELMSILAASRAEWPNLRFTVLGAGQRRLLAHLKQDQVDIVMALVPENPEGTARHSWTEELAWVRARNTDGGVKTPVPLVSYGERCLCHRAAVTALAGAGMTAELVFRANAAEALRSAVAAGVGVMLMPRGRVTADLEVWDDGPLPPAPAVYGGIFVRDGAGSEMLDRLADRFAQALRAPAAPERFRIAPPQPAAEGVRHTA